MAADTKDKPAWADLTDEDLGAVLEANRERIEALAGHDEDPATNVIAALARVMRDLPAIGRAERSEQGYQYRGIENITAHLQTLLGRHGVVFVPRVLKRETVALTINSRPWTEEQLEVVYKVYGP